MNKDFIEQLILKKEYSELTGEEREELREWVKDEQEYLELRAAINVASQASGHVEKAPDFILDSILKQIPPASFSTAVMPNGNDKAQPKKRRLLLYSITSIAASIVLIAGLYFMLQRTVESPETAAKEKAKKNEQETNSSAPIRDHEIIRSDKFIPQERQAETFAVPDAPVGIEKNEQSAVEDFARKDTKFMFDFEDDKPVDIKENIAAAPAAPTDTVNKLLADNQFYFSNSYSGNDSRRNWTFNATAPLSSNMDARVFTNSNEKLAIVQGRALGAKHKASMKLSENSEFVKISVELYR